MRFGVFLGLQSGVDDGLQHLVAHLTQGSTSLLVGRVLAQRSDTSVGSADGAAGQSASEEVQSHLRSLVCQRKAEGLVLCLALRHISVDCRLPLALFFGDEDVRHQVDDIRAHFLAAFGYCVLQDVLDGTLFPLALQQCIHAELLRQDFSCACDGAQRKGLPVVKASVLCADDGIRRCAGAHDAQRHRTADAAASGEAAGDGRVEQEVSHAHAGVVGEAAHAAPVPALLYGIGYLVADGRVHVRELVVALVLVDFPVLSVVSELSQIAQSLQRGSDDREDAAPHRAFLCVVCPVFLLFLSLSVVQVAGQVVDVCVGGGMFRVAPLRIQCVQVVEQCDFLIRHLLSLAVIQSEEAQIQAGVVDILPPQCGLVPVDVVVVDVAEAGVGVGAAPLVELFRSRLVGGYILAAVCEVLSAAVVLPAEVLRPVLLFRQQRLHLSQRVDFRLQRVGLLPLLLRLLRDARHFIVADAPLAHLVHQLCGLSVQLLLLLFQLLDLRVHARHLLRDGIRIPDGAAPAVVDALLLRPVCLVCVHRLRVLLVGGLVLVVCSLRRLRRFLILPQQVEIVLLRLIEQSRRDGAVLGVGVQAFHLRARYGQLTVQPLQLIVGGLQLLHLVLQRALVCAHCIAVALQIRADGRLAVVSAGCLQRRLRCSCACGIILPHAAVILVSAFSTALEGRVVVSVSLRCGDVVLLVAPLRE